VHADDRSRFLQPPSIAAVCAGIAAGVLSTLAQLALWWLFTDSLPGILFRDARLAAAIVMGPEVLPPAHGFDAAVMAVATIVHFALSIAYGLALWPLIATLRMRAALVVGAAFGLALFMLNMYGFTIVFPWFEVARDGITAAAHVAFGVSAAGVFKLLSARRADRSARPAR